MPRTVQIAARPEPITVVREETALIVVDMQHAYLSPGGYLDLCGFDVVEVCPARDVSDVTSLLAAQAMLTALGVLALRPRRR